MTNDIKEILDYLSDDSKSFIICGVSYYKISDYKAKVLLDYITNLQEENERVSNLYKTYEEANDLWIERNENLQQRIDKAVEYNKEIKNKIEKQLDNGQSYDFIVAGYLAIFHDTLEEILRGEE